MRHPLMSLPRTLLQDKCSGSEQGGSASVTATIVATDKEAKTAVVLFIAALLYRLSFVLLTIDACLQDIDFRENLKLCPLSFLLNTIRNILVPELCHGRLVQGALLSY